MHNLLPPRLIVVLALTAVLQAEPANATTVVFHDFTYDHYASAPYAAQQCGESGVTVLGIKVESDGQVSEARVVQSSGYADLDVAARQAALGWRYRVNSNDNSTFPHEARVEFSAPQDTARKDDRCSKADVDARAKEMEEAPLVNPARMPRGMNAPKITGRTMSKVDLGARRDEICKPDTFTHVFTLTIAVDGVVHKAEAHGLWGEPALDQAAIDFVNSLRFKPARSNGKAVAVSIFVFVTPRPLGATTCILRTD